MNKFLQFLDKHILKIGVAFVLVFVALYPKLPSIQVTHTWVYIRLEDFIIATLVSIWFIQLLRKKITLPFPVAIPIVLYWIVGFCSLIFSLIFIAPHLLNFFPKIAALQYLRRIEYMILFFIAFSTVKSKKDIRDYLIVLSVTLFFVILYGFGQRFYIPLSNTSKDFYKLLEKNPYTYCFPSFLTGNEEFAKGTPFCLSETSRITSTFGGHYDLAAYLVFVIPIFIGICIGVKKWYIKILSGILAINAIVLLNFTASRVSSISYFIGITSMLILWKKKKWLIPILAISFLILLSFNSSTLQRMLKTIQPVNIVTIESSATTPVALPPNLKEIINKTIETEQNKKPESPPPGAYIIGSPVSRPGTKNVGTPTHNAPITAVVTDMELKKLALENNDFVISTVSGKAYALDISFTTRFQSEWPRNWMAFMGSPVFGTGYSSLTLASDNDYLRALGETGFTGFLSFILIFIIFGIYMKHFAFSVTDRLTQAFIFGLAGGIIGLLVNAFMIDVFEASKVAESLWLLLGIGVGAAALHQKKSIDYKQQLFAFFTSYPMVVVYLFVITIMIFSSSLPDFFVADDFTWLKWADTSSMQDVFRYFLDAGGFFYRPLDKMFIYCLYTFFGLEPQGYHIFALFLHACTAFGVFVLLGKIFRQKLWAFLGAVLFIVLPAHNENVYWFATISTNLAALFLVWSVVAWIYFREKKIFAYTAALILSVLAFLSYEMAIIIIPLLLITDICLIKIKKNGYFFLSYIPFFFITSIYLYVRSATHAVSFGGDYSYSMVRFIPNFFGNLFGYAGLFIGGEYFLPLYTALRTNAKAYWFPIAIVLGIAVIFAILFILVKKKRIHEGLKKDTNTLIYGMLFFVVALLPFIGLGNISERYFYLASIGCIIAVISIIIHIINHAKRNVFIAAVLFFTGIIIFSSITVIHESQQWRRAGEITRKTLGILRTEYGKMLPDTYMFFANVPIRKENAWVFPVGLPDALWFVYRDSLPKIYQSKTIKDATDLADTIEKHELSFRKIIFLFDAHSDLQEIKIK